MCFCAARLIFLFVFCWARAGWECSAYLQNASCCHRPSLSNRCGTWHQNYCLSLGLALACCNSRTFFRLPFCSWSRWQRRCKCSSTNLKRWSHHCQWASRSRRCQARQMTSLVRSWKAQCRIEIHTDPKTKSELSDGCFACSLAGVSFALQLFSQVARKTTKKKQRLKRRPPWR